MKRLREWWELASRSSRLLVGVGMVAVLAFSFVFISQARTASRLEADLAAAELKGDEFASDTDALSAELAATREQLGGAEERLAAAEARIAELEGAVAARDQALVDAADAAEALAGETDEELSDAERALRAAIAEKEDAEELIAELTLAYSEDITAAMSTLAGSARTFACEWGTAQATDGQSLSEVTGLAALRAFGDSDALAALSGSREIATAISVAETLGEDPYGVTSDEVESIAVGCWQDEDAKLNVALYEHQSVFREAVLDAACTSGKDDAYEDSYNSGYQTTAAYQNWELTTGYSEAQDYIDAVEDRFGSIEDWLAIPDSDIEAESGRCDGIRDLIEPKGSRTWNVGDEIMPGTWKAYDVSDCYWARLAEDGDIRDNHFGDGLRLSVNVLSTDGQFEIDGCTFYYDNP